MGVLNQRQPSFTQFKAQFLKNIETVVGHPVDAYAPWDNLGDATIKNKIFAKVKKQINDTYHFEPVFADHLLEYDGPVEGVANQIHHVISTMYLIERINAKKRVALEQ